MHAGASCSTGEISAQFYWQELILQLIRIRPVMAGGARPHRRRQLSESARE
jgi:hypothetical protein